jgi:cytochrome oxidase assembly protein ShyY1
MIAFHVVCVATVVAMVNLSLWQFDRLDQRREFNSRVERRATEEVVDVTALDLSAPADFEWQRVGAAGTYQPADEVLILNRSQGGRAGLNVVTPLELEDGSILLVVRGFLPLELDVPRPPEGSVKVIGTARLSDARRSTDLNTSDGDVREFFRLDIDRIAEQIDGTVLPLALYADASEPAENPLLQPVARPTLSEGSHLSYAVQWIIFATAVVVGWILASRRTIKNQSRSRPSA